MRYLIQQVATYVLLDSGLLLFTYWMDAYEYLRQVVSHDFIVIDLNISYVSAWVKLSQIRENVIFL